jgi:hypothetical protein
VALVNRRGFIALAAASIAVCQTSSVASEPVAPNPDFTEAISELSDALDELDSNIDNFDSEDWASVVPTVRDAVSRVRQAFDRLSQEANQQ